MNSTYQVSFMVEGTETDAMSLRKSLAQSVADEFELRCVTGVTVVRSEACDGEKDQTRTQP